MRQDLLAVIDQQPTDLLTVMNWVDSLRLSSEYITTSYSFSTNFFTHLRVRMNCSLPSSSSSSIFLPYSPSQFSSSILLLLQTFIFRTCWSILRFHAII